MSNFLFGLGEGMTIVALVGLVGVLIFFSDNRAEAENFGH